MTINERDFATGQIIQKLNGLGGGGSGGGVAVVEYDPRQDMVIEPKDINDFVVDTTGTNIDLVNQKLEIVGEASYLQMKAYQQNAVDSSYIAMSIPLSPKVGAITIDFSECQNDAWGFCLLDKDWILGFEHYLGLNLFDTPRQIYESEVISFGSQDRKASEGYPTILRFSRCSSVLNRAEFIEFQMPTTSITLHFGTMLDVIRLSAPTLTDDQIIDIVGQQIFNEYELDTGLYVTSDSAMGEFFRVDFEKNYSLHFFITPFRSDSDSYQPLDVIPPIDPTSKLAISFYDFEVIEDAVSIPDQPDGTLVKFLNPAKINGKHIRANEVVVPFESNTKFLKLAGG